MNSFLRDFHGDSRISLDQNVLIHLKEGVVEVELEKVSLTGFHSYGENLRLNQKQITILELAKLIFANFGSGANEKEFVHFIEQSLNNMAMAIEYNGDREISNYLHSEKMLLLGHPFHPYPKCKAGMSEKDIHQYSPEFLGEINLVWIAVSETFFESNISIDEYKKKIENLISFDLCLNSDEILLPMHPWQWSRLKESGVLSETDIREIGVGENQYFALSSMRSFFNTSSPLQMKFSMDIKLTNSIRHLQANESIRGQQVETLLKNEGIEKKINNLSVLHEPFYGVLKDKNGNILNSSVVQFRENFDEEVNLEKSYLLSTLCEIIPGLGECFLSKILEKQENHILAKKNWFSKFLKNAIRPLIELYLREGILFGAHMQNIILEFDHEMEPLKVIYRDCQGTGLTEKAYEKYSQKYEFIRDSKGNILSKDDVNKVFGYYLVVNTVFQTISSLSNSEQYLEKLLLTDFRTFLFSLRAEFKDDFLDYLLESEELYQKGNMRCCIESLNENTIDSPWKIYNKIPNPLKALRQLNMGRTGYLYQYDLGYSKLSLRTLEESDLEIFYKWHHQDFVKEFWELDVFKEELLKYIRNLKASPYQLPLILEKDSMPVGYFEAYWAFDDRIAPYCGAEVYDRGIHLLFGEQKVLRSRFIYDGILHATKFLLEDDQRTERVWGEPRSDNKKILKFAEKLPGWRFIKEFDFPHKRSALIVCEKELFFKEYNEGALL